MAPIEVLSWEEARSRAMPIRFAVFVDEQRVPASLEMDDNDALCIHALAVHEGNAIGTGRLLPDGHIGRMAVLKAWRGRGVGSSILTALIEAARKRGDRELVLSAQVSAIAFYRAHGFAIEGPVYEEAGIPHQQMRRTL
jgi:predicted GNAT family N-acyltransferase